VLNSTIDQADLPESARADLRLKFGGELPKFAILGEVDRDPSAALAKLQAGGWTGIASPAAIHHGIEAAQSEIRRLDAAAKSAQAEARGMMKYDLANRAARAFDGQPVAPLTPDQAALLHPVELQRHNAEVAINGEIGRLVRSGGLMPPEELAQTLGQLSPRPDDPDYALKAEAYRGAMDRVGQMMAARDKDPAGYVAQASPTIRPLWQSGDVARAVTATKGVLEGLGMGDRLPVPAQQVQQFALSIAETKNGDQVNGLITSMASAVGPEVWPRLWRATMATGKVPAALGAVPMLNLAHSGALTTAILESEANSKILDSVKGRIATKQIEVAQSANGSVPKFLKALSIMNGMEVDPSIRTGLLSAVQDYAKSLVVRGAETDGTTAYNRAAHALIGEVYHVEAGSGNALVFQKNPDVDPDETVAVLKRQLLDPQRVKEFSRADERSYSLGMLSQVMINIESSGNTRAVSERNGKPIAYGLSQLLPSTAAEVAEKLGLPKPTPEQLLSDPDLNRRLGTEYFRQNLVKYGWSGIGLKMAVAAYNGGPGWMDGAIQRFGDPRDTGDWDGFARSFVAEKPEKAESARHVEKFMAKLQAASGRSDVDNKVNNPLNLSIIATPDGKKAFTVSRGVDGLWTPLLNSAGQRLEMDIGEAERLVSYYAQNVNRHSTTPKGAVLRLSPLDPAGVAIVRGQATVNIGQGEN